MLKSTLFFKKATCFGKEGLVTNLWLNWPILIVSQGNPWEMVGQNISIIF